ncbi:MAG: DTW domain-containing protein [Alphaproteobacteria bacterium]|nr:DTW domain-containing protein [Alphaproteobacteria bacterium]MCB9792245.1 DTW domain-containing protein [Alphaproteobacteria bacterium]
MPELHYAPPGRCPRCGLPTGACVCADIHPVQAPFELLLLRHWKEAFSSTNSARLARLALRGATLHDHGAPEPHGPLPDLHAELSAPGTWLLFPGGQEQAPPDLRRLVVVDGSWRQAARMVKRIPGLAELPRYSPPPRDPARARVRQQHTAGGMATLEAVARAVAGAAGEEAAAPLERLFALYVERVNLLRTYPARTR